MLLVTETLLTAANCYILVCRYSNFHFVLNCSQGRNCRNDHGCYSQWEKGRSNKSCYHWTSVGSGTLQQTFRSFDSNMKITLIWMFQTRTRSTNLFGVVQVLPACRRQNEHNQSKKLDASRLYCLKYSTLKLLVLCLILWRLKISVNLLNFRPTRREKVTVSFCQEKTSPNFQKKRRNHAFSMTCCSLCVRFHSDLC